MRLRSTGCVCGASQIREKSRATPSMPAQHAGLQQRAPLAGGWKPMAESAVVARQDGLVGDESLPVDVAGVEVREQDLPAVLQCARPLRSGHRGIIAAAPSEGAGVARVLDEGEHAAEARRQPDPLPPPRPVVDLARELHAFFLQPMPSGRRRFQTLERVEQTADGGCDRTVGIERDRVVLAIDEAHR